MKSRPHQIDGFIVEVYRSVPDQGSLKANKGVTNLIVESSNDELKKEDIQRYFENLYGTVMNSYTIKRNSSYRINFIDYDSVDKALLNKPHCINSIHIEIRKGDRDYPKLTERIQTSTQNSLKTKYRIHITNIPITYDAYRLSELFDDWPLCSILMKPTHYQDISTECWLIDIYDERTAENFIYQWNRKSIDNLSLNCCVEKDTTDLCKFFQIGDCSAGVDNCDWQHIKCSEYQTCREDNCSYGHARNVKQTMIESKDSYRIKIMGFQTELTSQLLASLLDYTVDKCYIYSHTNRIGYIIKLKSIKLAKRLFQKWHECEINGGHRLQCQLELNNSFSVHSHQPLTYTITHTRDSSCSRNSFDSGIIAFDERIDSLKLELPTFALRLQWEVTKKADEGEHVLLIRKCERINRRHLAVFKNCKTSNEITALTILKDMENIPQLIEHSSNSTSSWMIMERVPGLSLAKFIQRKDNHSIDLLQSVELVQQLLKIVKRLHSHDVFHRNLQPKHIMIEWDPSKTSIKQAKLTLISFSQVFIKLETNNCINSQSKQDWYQPNHTDAKGMQYLASMDVTNICAILFWLITQIVPEHDNDNNTLPHQQDEARLSLDNKIARFKKQKLVNIEQIKKYLYDTFNVAFGYPDYQPWSIDDLQIRLESICELLSPSSTDILSIEDISERMLTISKNASVTKLSERSSTHQDVFAKASVCIS
ncbi:hypothetical protein I4U23_012468 [Adineta vaga]|nr:hypothetical protein I4U23_012468 [Adineta vaga]